MKINTDKKKIFKISLLLISFVLIFSSGVNASSATNSSNIYVSTHGNDSWNGLSSNWIGNNNGPKATIKNATDTVDVDGTVHIAKGAYKGFNNNHFTISKNLTIIGQSTQGTIICGNYSNGAFDIAPGAKVTISNLTFKNFKQYYGGAIYNYGSLVVNGCTFTNNYARLEGGAINNDNILILINSKFINNTAADSGGAISGTGFTASGCTFLNNTSQHEGGAIKTYGTLTLTNSSFINNTAVGDGGAIMGGGLTARGCTFEGNTAYYGSAFYNFGPVSSIEFCRIVNNSPNTSQIAGDWPVNALYNWWGTNSDPSVYVTSNVNASVWMVLKINANPNSILNGNKSIITANLTFDNLDYYHDPSDRYVPNGTPVTFAGTLGSFSEKSTFLSNGIATSTFTANSGGSAKIYTVIDNQTVNTKITVNNLPKASSNIPCGVYNTTQHVILSMTRAGNIYYTTNGLNPTINSTRYLVPISITASTTLKFLAIGNVGNMSPIYTMNYTIDKVPPKITSTTPANNAKKVSLTAPITIKFSEKISKGANFSKIYVKNMTTGKITQTTTTISGNTLTIKMTRSRLSLNNYEVYIPTGALKDVAGNKNTKYLLNFRTSRY